MSDHTDTRPTDPAHAALAAERTKETEGANAAEIARIERDDEAERAATVQTDTRPIDAAHAAAEADNLRVELERDRVASHVPPAGGLGPARDNTLAADGSRMPHSPDRPGDRMRTAANMPNRTPPPPAPAHTPGRPWHLGFKARSVTAAIAHVAHPHPDVPEHARNALSSLLHSLEHDGPVEVDAGHDGAGEHHLAVKHIPLV